MALFNALAPLQTLADGQLFQALILIKKQLPNIRIDNIGEHYLVIRDLGKNAYQPLNPLEGLRIRFRRTRKGSELEFQKKDYCEEKEIYLFVQLIRFLAEKNDTIDEQDASGIQNLKGELEQLGIQVTLPPETTNPSLASSSSSPSSSSSSSPSSSSSSSPSSSSKEFVNALPTLPGFVGYPDTRKALYQNVVIPLTHPEIFEKLKRMTRMHSSSRAATPRAILFAGPPGVGKTTVSRNLAQQSKVPLLCIPVERILSKYYGESEGNLMRVFDLAARFPKAIVFIDELDALATSREGKIFEATRRLLSVLLTSIDGFQKTGSILTIGATNRRQDLDAALLSRFDTIIHFQLPDLESRKKIVYYYAQHLQNSELTDLATAAETLSGRDLENLCIQAEREWGSSSNAKQGTK